MWDSLKVVDINYRSLAAFRRTYVNTAPQCNEADIDWKAMCEDMASSLTD
jgi:hypothetical protein